MKAKRYKLVGKMLQPWVAIRHGTTQNLAFFKRMGAPPSRLTSITLIPLASVAAAAISIAFGPRLVLGRVMRNFVHTMVQDPYYENLWQMVTEFQRVGPTGIQETELRAQSPQPLMRPLGSPTAQGELHRVSFNTAQLSKLPTPLDTPIKTSVVIGSGCAKPLQLSTPLIVGAIENSFLLNKRVRIAMAQGAAAAGTALNAGNAPALLEERQASRKLIMQYHRGNWMQPEALRLADSVEITLAEGPGGSAGVSFAGEIEPDVIQSLHMPNHAPVYKESRYTGMSQASDLANLVAQTRELAPGVPVGVRISSNQSLEHDLAFVLDAGVDFVTLSTPQAGTLRGLPIFQDDFGVPALWAVTRARQYLDTHDPEKRVSLLVNGGISTPGGCLKCLALGADAVCLCSASLFAAMAGQQKWVTPYEPPVVMLLQNQRYARYFSIEHGARNVRNWLLSYAAEMVAAVRSIGKTNIADVGLTDLCALDIDTAATLGIPFVGTAVSQTDYKDATTLSTRVPAVPCE